MNADENSAWAQHCLVDPQLQPEKEPTAEQWAYYKVGENRCKQLAAGGCPNLTAERNEALRLVLRRLVYTCDT